MPVGDKRLTHFTNIDVLADWLAAQVARDLAAAIENRGRASLACSGGNTPRFYLPRLAQQVLPWAQVTITLTDERWVPIEHEASNERLVRMHLLGNGPASQANWIGWYRPDVPLEEASKNVEARLQPLPRPLDVALLGMGEDGHIASLFVQKPEMEASFITSKPERGSDYHRVSLALQTIASARIAYLVILGKKKKYVMEDVLSGQLKNVPVATWLTTAKGKKSVLWAPERAIS